MKIDVWQEGYLLTGMEGYPAKAEFHGTYETDSFENAVRMWVKENPTYAQDIDYERLTWWGCKLFDNEDAARKFEIDCETRMRENYEKERTLREANKLDYEKRKAWLNTPTTSEERAEARKRIAEKIGISNQTNNVIDLEDE